MALRHGLRKSGESKERQQPARGGITMGIEMALTEETLFYERRRRIMNPSLSEYYVPVDLDVPGYRGSVPEYSG